jgi:predicted alpha-1,2-mannosidase
MAMSAGRVLSTVSAIVEVCALVCADTTTAGAESEYAGDLTRHVLPLMGSDSSFEFSTGNTYPAVCRPNGMHLWTLQTGANGDGWLYRYRDMKIRGVRQTHQPSPWINDHGAWSFMPLTRDALGADARSSWFSHKEETFEPYRMKVHLAEDCVTVELTATERAALARVTYPETDTPYFIVDAYGDKGKVRIDAASRRIWGESAFSRAGNLPEGFKNHFVLEFDRAFTEAGASGSVVRIKFEPMKRGETVSVKIASSYISGEQAVCNLGELGDGDFTRLAAEGRDVWNARLGRIRVEGGSVDDLRKFYTCLYRTQIFPLALHEYDADGNAVHRNPETGRVEKGVYYAGTGFWDTFRALFPLLNFVYPDVNAKMTEGLRNCWRENGWLPEWSAPGFVNCMIGNNSASVVADACLTPGVASRETAEELYTALVHGANAVKDGNPSCGRLGWEYYNRFGYVPRDVKISYSAARTLEYAYDDWCIWRLGVALGRLEDETGVYLKRSGNWRNVFNPAHNLMCGRAADGAFDSNFDPFDWGGDFVEGCSWHYTWSVFHDVAGLAEAMGGKAAFAKMLDKVFELPSVFRGYGGKVIHEMREMQVMDFGQYAHGNQPIQHMIYLYDWTDEPWKTQYWAREAMNRLYKPTPDGYCGDEDNGQTSAWFVWSALGMYPVCPASGEYALGAPLFEKTTVTFPDGCRLVVSAPDVTDRKRYAKRVSHNGMEHIGNFLKRDSLRDGGELAFEMSDSPTLRTSGGELKK